MSKVSDIKLKLISIMFFIGGLFGTFSGLFYFMQPNIFVSAIGMVCILIGVFCGFHIIRSKKQLEEGK